METLKTIENESLSSDEDNAEENNIMFEKAASSTGSKSGGRGRRVVLKRIISCLKRPLPPLAGSAG